MWIVVGFAAVGIAVGLVQFLIGRRLLRAHKPMLFSILYLLERLLADALVLVAAWRVSNPALLSAAVALSTAHIAFAAALLYVSSKGEGK
ncbi:MAG: hypothetical protein PHO66_02780 [Eubacteriales bacterium]|nr:hypothetical protein [Eubacteriales bacterium]